MAELEVALFGGFQVQCDGKKMEGVEAYKVKELLSYLLIYRERMLLRESLAELFWEDQPSAQSKKYLRQTIWKLKSAMERNCQAAASDLVVEVGWIRVNPSPAIWRVDLIEFESTCLALKNKRSRELTADEFVQLQLSVDLYTGDLLEGWYQNWCIAERERFQAAYLILLNKLVQYCAIHQHIDTGLTYGEKLLRHDRAHERTHRQMMRLYYMAGDRTRALRQYECCVSALRDELDIGPSERTIVLYEQIKADRRHLPDAPAIPDDPQLAKSMLKNTAKRLDQYAETLTQIQSQIQKEINTLEGQLLAKQ